MTAEQEAPESGSGVAATLERSREALMDAIVGLNEEGFRTRAGPEAWTVAEVLAHLLADETKLAALARDASAGREVTVPPTHDAAHDRDAREAAKRMPAPQIIHALLARRRDTLSLIESLSSDQLALHVQHPAYGRTDVARLLLHVSEHEMEHAGQIRSIRSHATPASP
jgi:uncharacterized damage-inducible protein DinB